MDDDYHHEPGTIWPHLSRPPNWCVVEILNNNPTEVIIVDSLSAFVLLKEQFPEAFNYLSECELEYGWGTSKVRHPICSISENGRIIPGVFNNLTRSSAITVDSVEKLYQSLQKYGRICADIANFIKIFPGQNLVFNNWMGMLGVPSQTDRKISVTCLT